MKGFCSHKRPDSPTKLEAVGLCSRGGCRGGSSSWLLGRWRSTVNHPLGPSNNLGCPKYPDRVSNSSVPTMPAEQWALCRGFGPHRSTYASLPLCRFTRKAAQWPIGA